MKNFILFIALLMGGLSGLSAQAQVTLVKSVALNAAKSLVIEFPGQVEIKEWDEPHARVQTTIEVANAEESLVKRLVAANRYQVETETRDNGLFALAMSNLNKPVIVRGQQLQERCSYEIFVPRGMRVEIKAAQAQGVSL